MLSRSTGLNNRLTWAAVSSILFPVMSPRVAKPRRWSVFLPTCFILLPFVGCITQALAQTNYMRIKAFGFAELSSSQPLVGPVEGSDGRLYGTTSAGGTNGFGSVYSLNRDGSGYTELYSFANPTRVDPSGLAEG